MLNVDAPRSQRSSSLPLTKNKERKRYENGEDEKSLTCPSGDGDGDGIDSNHCKEDVVWLESSFRPTKEEDKKDDLVRKYVSKRWPVRKAVSQEFQAKLSRNRLVDLFSVVSPRPSAKALAANWQRLESDS
uniref:Uncharacterized protein n=1 Tax=Vespula pensylvanica TaxID=30213 RepID=A0A834P4I4_VESPE|nr:hypothetical protein H0235_007253 [Vespula pensylvanica]